MIQIILYDLVFNTFPDRVCVKRLVCYIAKNNDFSPFPPLDTISKSLWASLHHHVLVLSVFRNVSCQFVSFHIFLSVATPPPSSLPRHNHVYHCSWDAVSSSLLLMYPYQFNRFCLRTVDMFANIKASSFVFWFLTWSFLVLPLIYRSILISATCNLFSSICFFT